MGNQKKDLIADEAVCNPPKAVLVQVEYLPKTHQLVDF